MWAILIKMTDAHASGEIQEPSANKTPTRLAARFDDLAS
jgi:hypothetical protein